MKARIIPGLGEGQAIRIPSSKSLSHRALIAASLAEGTSWIRNSVKNNDTLATMNCLKQLGAVFEETDADTLKVKGIRDLSAYDGSLIDCGESGSTLRFLIPLFAMCEKEAVFTGHGKLMERPQTVYEQLFHEHGLLFEKDGAELRVHGTLPSGTYRVAGNVSSQFITGLLFALPLGKGESVIEVIPPYESRSYVGLTQDVLELSGIRVLDQGNRIIIPADSHYHPIITDVDGDDSQAAFFAALALLSKKAIAVYGIPHESRQGDHVMIELIERFGGRSVPVENGFRFEPGELRPCVIDLADCPDLGPVLFALASAVPGTSVFAHCTRLRIKESDRISAMKEEAEKLGAIVEDEGDTVRITGMAKLKGNVSLNGHNDHRIVMALSVLAQAADGPLEIDGCEAVNKSYPDFFRDYETAGGRVTLQ